MDYTRLKIRLTRRTVRKFHATNAQLINYFLFFLKINKNPLQKEGISFLYQAFRSWLLSVWFLGTTDAWFFEKRIGLCWFSIGIKGKKKLTDIGLVWFSFG